MNSKKELEKNFDMEEINPKTVRFFEGLLKHKPIREVLIEQLNILDSLTLIRLSKASPSLNDLIKDNADIWVSRIQQQTKKIRLPYAIKYYEESDKFPGMYKTSLIFRIFPSLLDVFLFFVTYLPHIWLPKKVEAEDQPIRTTQDVITCQDWNVKFKDQKNGFNLEIFKSFYIYEVFFWTKSKRENENGTIADYKFEPKRNSRYTNLISNRPFHQLELVPRIGYWFKYYDRDVSFVLTQKLPKRTQEEPWPECNIPLKVAGKFGNTKEYFFVFNNYNLSKIELMFHEKEDFKKNAIMLENQMYSGKFQFLGIRGRKNQISPYFNVTFFILLTAVRVYVFSDDMLDRFREYNTLREMRKNRDKNDVILIVETIVPIRHFAKEDQMEFLIESCVECQKPATLQCSGCNRAVYCGEECGKKSWEQGLHSKVCKHI
jgi:MYND finger